MAKSSGNLIGCCVANIGSSSKFRCNECHQKCHQSCVTNRVSPICVTKCFKMSFRRRFYLTPIFWFRSQFFRIFRSIPNFPFTFYNLKRKFLLIFLSRSRSNEVIGIKSLFLSLWFNHQHVEKTTKAVINIDVSNHCKRCISYLKIKLIQRPPIILWF